MPVEQSKDIISDENNPATGAETAPLPSLDKQPVNPNERGQAATSGPASLDAALAASALDGPAVTNPLTASSYDSPMIAEDVDVIEKEWVDKAEAEVRRTADDPHAQEEAIETLQVEYMRKRYGKEIRREAGE